MLSELGPDSFSIFHQCLILRCLTVQENHNFCQSFSFSSEASKKSQVVRTKDVFRSLKAVTEEEKYRRFQMTFTHCFLRSSPKQEVTPVTSQTDSL